MEKTIDTTMARQAYQSGNLKSALLTRIADTSKWIMRFQLEDDEQEVVLNGAKKRLRCFATIDTALKVAKAIGFERVEIDLS